MQTTYVIALTALLASTASASLIDLTFTGTSGSATKTVSFYIPVESDIVFSYGFVYGSGSIPTPPSCSHLVRGCVGFATGFVSFNGNAADYSTFDFSCNGPNACTNDYVPFSWSHTRNLLAPGTYTFSVGISYGPNDPLLDIPATNTLSVDAYIYSGQILPAAPAPEPFSFLLLGSGLAILALRHKRRFLRRDRKPNCG